MRFRKIALALFACMALGALAANVAQAAPEWTLGTTENQTTAGTRIVKEGVSCKKHGTSGLELTSKFLGAPVKLTATGIDCVGATIDTVVNKEGVGISAHSAGQLLFTEVKVVEPANCEVGGVKHELLTAALTDEVIMDATSGSTTVFDKFFTDKKIEKEKEVEVPFVTVTFEGALCSIKGESAPVKGTACGEAVHTVEESGKLVFKPNATGTLTKVQTLSFGSAQQSTGGCALTLGKEPAFVTGAVDNELNGSVTPANAGKPFGAD